MVRIATMPVIVWTFACLVGGVDAAANGETPSIDAPSVYKDPPCPENNPWQSVGIPSRYRFGAYYTRKDCDETWNARSRTDEYSDVIVKFDNSQDELVFGRRTSYRPVWITATGEYPFPRLHSHVGDGPVTRPDAINRFARARIIRSDDEAVVVHWRYLPEPPTDIENPDPTAFIDEYFVITPDRHVQRGMRCGTPRIDDWRRKLTVCAYELGADGVNALADPGDHSAVAQVMELAPAAPPRSEPAAIRAFPGELPPPYAAWTFDEGIGDATTERVSKTSCDITGHRSYWQAGVSGSSLGFDGWYSRVTLPPTAIKRPRTALTVDAWAAIAAYPWNYCPIIQQGDVIDEGQGWFLGISPDGHPTLAVMVDGARQVLESEQRIELFQWAHLTGVIDTAAGSMTLFINGQEVTSRAIPVAEIDYPAKDAAALSIGQGPPLHTAWRVRSSHPYPYSFDGLIDEIRLLDSALSSESVADLHRAMDSGESARRNPDLEERKLPTFDSKEETFAAHYTHINFHGMWDNMYRMSGHPDIVVTFDKSPTQYVLWHGAGYVPMLVSENGRWYSNEFNETWWRGCCEPMSDKKMMFGRVHIIEQSPARIVLKWRYPLCNVFYGIYGEDDSPDGWGEWVEWLFYIYPDGSIVKKMRVYAAEDHRHEWHESMAIMGPGQHPETVVDKNNTLELVTAAGEVRQYNWIIAPPTDVDYDDAIVHKVNLYAKYDPYTIAKIDSGNVYRGERTDYAVFPSWDHWPVSQLRSDGRKSHYSDRTSHSSLTHIYWDSSVKFGEQGFFEEKVLLEGMTDKPARELLPLARFFLTPPETRSLSQNFAVRFDHNQKAYVLTRDSGDATTLRLKVAASDEHPVVNPAIVVENWGSEDPATLKLSGQVPGEFEVRQGLERRANGVTALVVWLELAREDPITIEIAR